MIDRCNFKDSDVNEYTDFFSYTCLKDQNESIVTTEDSFFGSMFEEANVDNRCTSVEEVMNLTTPMAEDFIKSYELGAHTGK